MGITVRCCLIDVKGRYALMSSSVCQECLSCTNVSSCLVRGIEIEKLHVEAEVVEIDFSNAEKVR